MWTYFWQHPRLEELDVAELVPGDLAVDGRRWHVQLGLPVTKHLQRLILGQRACNMLCRHRVGLFSILKLWRCPTTKALKKVVNKADLSKPYLTFCPTLGELWRFCKGPRRYEHTSLPSTKRFGPKSWHTKGFNLQNTYVNILMRIK